MAIVRARDITELSTEFLLCRATRAHPWEPRLTTVSQVERKKAYDTTWVCPRCGTEKHELWSGRDGQLVARDPYDYPDGYLLSKDAISGMDPRTLRGALRLELFGRYTGETDHGSKKRRR